MRALILNDTRSGNHLGCIIVMQQLEALCREAGIEVAAMLRLGRHFQAEVEQALPGCDVVIINGEGTMHHDAPGAMAIARAGRFAAERGVPVALLNTVWQGNHAANALLAHCRWISARESVSQQAIAEAGHPARVVPDLTLSADPAQLFGGAEAGPGAGLVVTDDVRLEPSLTLAHFARARNLPYYPMAGRPSLRSQRGWAKLLRLGLASGGARQFCLDNVGAIARAAFVVTGRFHGICLAILARRPFVAFASNTHKIEGLLSDAGLGPGGQLFDDPPADPAARDAFVDAAVQQVQRAVADPVRRADYEAACARYAQRARRQALGLLAELRNLRPPG
jgi:hypothetical protein